MPSSSNTLRFSFMATGELVSNAFSLVRSDDTCPDPPAAARGVSGAWRHVGCCVLQVGYARGRCTGPRLSGGAWECGLAYLYSSHPSLAERVNHGGNRRRAAILSVLLTSTPLVPVDDLLSAKSGSLIASAEAMSASASSGLNERAETDHFQGSGVRHMEYNVQEGSASST